MSVRSRAHALTTIPVLVGAATATAADDTRCLTLQADADIYIGGPDVTAANGIKITAGTFFQLIQSVGDELWARSVTGTANASTCSTRAEAGTVAPPLPPSVTEYTGGAVSDSGGYRYHTFNTSGTLTEVTSGEVEYLVVAGGGGGGGRQGGGGGAGGSLDGTTTPGTTETVTIGGGGAAGGPGASGTNGSASSLGALSVVGGGGGGTRASNGKDGACGGGAGGDNSGANATGGVASVGFDGGSVTVNSFSCGGGGMTVVGDDAVGTVNGDGGAGIEWPASSGDRYAGGAGGGSTSTAEGAGVDGGGDGQGITGGLPAAQTGTANTGGGGGGGNSSEQIAAAGGSGVVIVRYLFTP